MKCPDCNERKAFIKSNVTGNVRRCSECDDIKREELGLYKPEGFGSFSAHSASFEPYWLPHGNLKAVQDDPHFDKENRQIYIQNQRREDEVMLKMGCHVGEKGEDVCGHKLGEKPDDAWGDRQSGEIKCQKMSK